MFHYVYAIVNLINEKIYIGKHSTSNLDDGYMGSGKLIKLAIKKYGIENFEKVILEQFETEELALEYEKQLVTENYLKNNQTYNLTLGGKGSWYRANQILTHSWRQKTGKLGGKLGNDGLKKRLYEDKEFRINFNKMASLTAKKNWETGKFSSNTWIGRKHKEETKKKICLANSKSQLGERNSHFGTVWIYNLELKISKSIKKEELEDYLNQGWIKGRKMKFEN